MRAWTSSTGTGFNEDPFPSRPCHKSGKELTASNTTELNTELDAYMTANLNIECNSKIIFKILFFMKPHIFMAEHNNSTHKKLAGKK